MGGYYFAVSSEGVDSCETLNIVKYKLRKSRRSSRSITSYFMRVTIIKQVKKL